MSWETDAKYILRMLDDFDRRLKFQERLETPAIGDWTSYTPTVTYYGGTTDPDSTVKSFRYARIGNTVFFTGLLTITVGSGDRTYFHVTLPIASANNGWAGSASPNFSGENSVAAAYGHAGLLRVYTGDMSGVSSTWYLRVSCAYEAG